MTVTSEQAREIIRWGNQHRRMLRENYRPFSIHELLTQRGFLSVSL